MDKAAQQVLALLARHGNDLQGVLGDGRLDEALVPFREDRPRLVRCPAPNCRGKLVYIAVDPHAPALVGKSSGPVSDELLAKRRRDFQLPATRYDGLPTLYEHWSVTGGRRTIGMEVDTHLHPHHRLRWILTCPRPKCGKRYLVTHTQLLALLVARIAQGPGEIMLPVGCDLGPDETVRPLPNSVD